jgi:hypothetical protein
MFLVFNDQIKPIANTFVKASIAHLNASQLDADVVEPNTIAVTRLHKSLAMEPKAPFKSA